MKRFESKTVMVTGAGRNIGREIALSFAKEGANVIVCDINSENALSVVGECEALGVSAMALVGDVRYREKIFQGVSEALEKFGKIDVLINNAGGSAGLIGKLSHFVDAEPETLDFVLDINIKGSMNCAQAVLPSMIENRYGKIINMSSIAAVSGIAYRVDYSAAKAALIGMARALAMEVGQYNICVNCISPGAIHRDGAKWSGMTFLGEDGHGGDPIEIAETAMFLAENNYITGQNIVVDGGRILGPLNQKG